MAAALAAWRPAEVGCSDPSGVKYCRLVLIRNWRPLADSGVERLVLSDKPAIARPSHLYETGGRNIQFGMDLDRRIAHEARWPRGRVCAVVRVVADSSIKTVLANDTQSWEKFIAAFDGARSLMRISLPVYSQDGKRAVIYTESTCPYTCGGGFYHELEKTHSGWRIIGSLNAWTA